MISLITVYSRKHFIQIAKKKFVLPSLLFRHLPEFPVPLQQIGVGSLVRIVRCFVFAL
jgi:hypothetical protein